LPRTIGPPLFFESAIMVGNCRRETGHILHRSGIVDVLPGIIRPAEDGATIAHGNRGSLPVPDCPLALRQRGANIECLSKDRLTPWWDGWCIVAPHTMPPKWEIEPAGCRYSGRKSVPRSRKTLNLSQQVWCRRRVRVNRVSVILGNANALLLPAVVASGHRRDVDARQILHYFCGRLRKS
jgi:hypothetical protein